MTAIITTDRIISTTPIAISKPVISDPPIIISIVQINMQTQGNSLSQPFISAYQY
jgi:hypothetical protein